MPRFAIPSRLLLPIVLGALFLGISPGGALAQGQWTLRNPLPTGLELESAVWTGQTILAVGNRGAALSSPDGQTWTDHSLATGEAFFAVAHGNGLFVATGWLEARKTYAIFTSKDGKAWKPQARESRKRLYDVLWTGNRFVIVGDSGTILTSQDGEAWKTATSGTRYGLRKAVLGDSLIVAVGDSGMVVSSRDGEAWTAQATVKTFNLKQVAFGGGRFVATADYISSRSYGALVSRDGRTWTESRVANYYYSLAWVKDRFLASGIREIYLSKDGETWETRPSQAFSAIKSWLHTGVRWVGMGMYGSVLLSEDGETFAPSHPVLTWRNLESVAWGRGLFVAVGEEGEIVSSPDGQKWERAVSGTRAALYHVAEHDGLWVAVGDTGTLLTSPDGRAWIKRATGSRKPIHGVTRCGSRWVATGEDVSLTSADGVAWTPDSMLVRLFGGIDLVEEAPVWSGSRVVVRSRNGEAMASSNGSDWKQGYQMEAGRPARLAISSSILWDGRRFVGISRGESLASEDGIIWSRQGNKAAAWPVTPVIRTGGRYVAADAEGTGLPSTVIGWVSLSLDGMAWNAVPIPGTLPIQSVTASPDLVVAVGYRGSILTSPVDPNLAVRPGPSSGRSFSLRSIGAQLLVVSPASSRSRPFRAILTSPIGETLRETFGHAGTASPAALSLEGLAPGSYFVDVRMEGDGTERHVLPFLKTP